MWSCWGVQGDAVTDELCHPKTDLGVTPSGIMGFACNHYPHVTCLMGPQKEHALSLLKSGTDEGCITVPALAFVGLDLQS